jgi:dihydrofolate reductase
MEQQTRRILMFNRVSADGYFAAVDGNMNWIVPDPDIDRVAAEGIPGTDLILFGRRTFDMFASYWPHALENPRPGPHGEPPSDAQRAFAVMLNETAKLVFSRTLADVTWKNSRVVPEFDPRQITALKRQPGKDIIIFGSGTIVSLLTQHGLIDEYQLIVNPTFLGGGKTLINGLAASVRLELVEARPYRSGNVTLRYAPRR